MGFPKDYLVEIFVFIFILTIVYARIAGFSTPLIALAILSLGISLLLNRQREIQIRKDEFKRFFKSLLFKIWILLFILNLIVSNFDKNLGNLLGFLSAFVLILSPFYIRYQQLKYGILKPEKIKAELRQPSHKFNKTIKWFLLGPAVAGLSIIIFSFYSGRTFGLLEILAFLMMVEGVFFLGFYYAYVLKPINKKLLIAILALHLLSYPLWTINAILPSGSIKESIALVSIFTMFLIPIPFALYSFYARLKYEDIPKLKERFRKLLQ